MSKIIENTAIVKKLPNINQEDISELINIIPNMMFEGADPFGNNDNGETSKNQPATDVIKFDRGHKLTKHLRIMQNAKSPPCT